jgi:hypothetical protein
MVFKLVACYAVIIQERLQINLSAMGGLTGREIVRAASGDGRQLKYCGHESLNFKQMKLAEAASESRTHGPPNQNQ